MTPFPEAEDMTVKRLYVALKRGDEQLLKMGAHKLHEKYHTGFEFRMFDELKDILRRLDEQNVPNDIKDLLTRTINNILNGVRPEYNGANQETAQGTAKESIPVIQTQVQTQMASSVVNQTPVQQQTIQIPSQNPTIQTPLGPIQAQNTNIQTSSIQLTTPTNNYNTSDTSKVVEFRTETTENAVSNNQYQETNTSLYSIKNEYETVNTPQFEAVRDVVVFYDDKAGFVDYDKNKAYRLDLAECALNRETNPIINASQVKNAVDTRADEAQDILRVLKNLKGNIDFITTSKSANILKTFRDLDIKFNVLNTNRNTPDVKASIYPLFGLSNIFVCPKCGKKEYFIDDENKVLSLQCSNCASVMYPDLYEAKDYETNVTPYYWLKSLNAMSKSEIWVLINPPLESSRALTCEFLKTAFDICKPKKVCIVSKDTAIKEYYRQMLREIVGNCEVRSEFANTDALFYEITKNMTLQAV